MTDAPETDASFLAPVTGACVIGIRVSYCQHPVFVNTPTNVSFWSRGRGLSVICYIPKMGIFGRAVGRPTTKIFLLQGLCPWFLEPLDTARAIPPRYGLALRSSSVRACHNPFSSFGILQNTLAWRSFIWHRTTIWHVNAQYERWKADPVKQNRQLATKIFSQKKTKTHYIRKFGPNILCKCSPEETNGL